MITTTHRVVFNLSSFIIDLEESLIVGESEKDAFNMPYVEDVVDQLKGFVKHSTEEVKKSSLKYLLKHPSVVENSRMRSFIMACF